jgi:hypothetical protein
MIGDLCGMIQNFSSFGLPAVPIGEWQDHTPQH